MKAQIRLRIDPDLLTWFKRQGPGYQARINAALRAFVEAHERKQAGREIEGLASAPAACPKRGRPLHG